MLKSVPDDKQNHLYFRHETLDGLWEVGIYPVLFGFRIRAGRVGDSYCCLDMCIGNNWLLMYALFPVVCKIIEERGHVPSMNEWPRVAIKPVWKDPEYLIQLNLMVRNPEDKEEYEVPALDQIRQTFLDNQRKAPGSKS